MSFLRRAASLQHRPLAVLIVIAWHDRKRVYEKEVV
jgi:hypothetical protein